MYNYNVFTLIEAVRDRPCLWDKTVEEYKDRAQKKTAWEEIYNMLDERYEGMTERQKRDFSTTIIAKWTNIRDSFIRNLKAKGKKKKYILHDQMIFLKKVVKDVPDEEDQEEIDKYEEERRKRLLARYEPREEDTALDNPEPTPRKRRSPNIKYEKDEDDVHLDFHKRRSQPVEVEVDCLPLDDDKRVMNEDEAFFASLLPTVVRYDEGERLEFRMQVLAIMKKIKDNRGETITDDDKRVKNEDEAFFASLLSTVVRYDEGDRLEFRMQVLTIMKKIKDNRSETITG